VAKAAFIRCFRNGAKLDVPGIVRIARAKGAMVLLDCYQAAGSLDIAPP
jgi:selenocysteine lyase/cysteine desulfurase